jgi:integrase
VTPTKSAIEHEVPSPLDQARRIRAIANKRTEERPIDHLTKEEMKVVPDALDPNTRLDRRDQAMLYLGFAAGLRVSDLIGLHLGRVELDGPYPSIPVNGKGRKQRRLPLWKEATRDIRKVALWLGHSSLKSTEIYLRADPTEKSNADVCRQHELSRARDSSCKARACCPSCGGRRMAERAAHLVEHVFPRVPVRQRG